MKIDYTAFKQLSALKVVLYIADAGGQAQISTRDLARACRLGHSNAVKGIKSAVADGWIKVDKSENTHTYTLLDRSKDSAKKRG